MKKIIVFFVILIATCHITNGQQGENNPIIKVLSFNIYHGENTQGKSNIDAIATLINQLQPDFVGLQEVDVTTERSNFTDISTLLGYRTKMHPVFAKAMDFNKGEYGVTLLSKHSFKAVQRHNLPNTTNSEPRVLIAVNTMFNKQELRVLNTHFDHDKNDSLRIIQANYINKLFCQDNYPKILIGDLNALPNSKPIHHLKKYWKLSDESNPPLATYPSDTPSKKIDYIMVYPANKWKVLESRVINTGETSDHLAYFVSLQLL
ncbi:MAG: hypothetical protein COB81_02625 [Flavobacteriaceae bacterium]|nr:MAG: hypothetical protein COB81_02625 [Flavobacteriaceae bacterium]